MIQIITLIIVGIFDVIMLAACFAISKAGQIQEDIDNAP